MGELLRYVGNAYDETQRTYILKTSNGTLALEGRFLNVSDKQYQRISQSRFDGVLSFVAACNELEAEYRAVPSSFADFKFSLGRTKSDTEKAEGIEREKNKQQRDQIEAVLREIPNCSFSDD